MTRTAGVPADALYREPHDFTLQREPPNDATAMGEGFRTVLLYVRYE